MALTLRMAVCWVSIMITSKYLYVESCSEDSGAGLREPKGQHGWHTRGRATTKVSTSGIPALHTNSGKHKTVCTEMLDRLRLLVL